MVATYNSSTSSKVKNITYMEDRELQHLENVNIGQTYDGNSIEKILFQYISNNARILGLSLVQM